MLRQVQRLEDLFAQLCVFQEQAAFHLSAVFERLLPGTAPSRKVTVIAIEDSEPDNDAEEVPWLYPENPTGQFIEVDGNGAHLVAPPDPRCEALADCLRIAITDGHDLTGALAAALFAKGESNIVSDDEPEFLAQVVNTKTYFFAFVVLTPGEKLLDKLGPSGSFIRHAINEWLRLAARQASSHPHPLQPALSITPDEFALRAARTFVRRLAQPGVFSDGEQEYYDFLNAISLETYEKADAVGQLDVLSRFPKKREPELSLTPAVDLSDSRRVRKLLHGAQTSLSLLLLHSKVVGFRERGQEWGTLAATIKFIAGGVWEIHAGEETLLRIVRGRPEVPQLGVHVRITQTISERLGEYPQGALEQLEQGIKEILASSQGAIIVLTSHASSEAGDSRMQGRLGQQGTRVRPRSIEARHLVEVSRIDGAVILDLSGYLHAFGVILDGTSPQVGAIPIPPPPASLRERVNARIRRNQQLKTQRAERSLPDPSRGARFNSAASYVLSRLAENERVCAVVISEDGMVNVLPTDLEWEEFQGETGGEE